MAAPRRKTTVEDLYPHLGRILRGIRRSKGLTQEQVGEAIGMTGTAVGGYEKGRSRIPLAQFVHWCNVMGVGPGEVLDQMAMDLMIMGLSVAGEEGEQGV